MPPPNNLLTTAITAARGKNPKAVMALLDLDTIKASKNQESELKTAIEQAAKENDYLFEPATPPSYAAATGVKPPRGAEKTLHDELTATLL